MEKHPIGDLMAVTMQKIREMVDVNTIIGTPIKTDGITLIPVSKVTFGFASGGTDFGSGKNKPQPSNNFGGGSGAGVNIIPVAFIVIKGESVRIMNIQPPAATTVDRVLDMAPDVIDKIGSMIKKDKKTEAPAAEEEPKAE